MQNKSSDECLTPALKPVDQTIRDLISTIECKSDIEMVATDNLLNRILAEPLTCPFDFPAWPCSAMDGYAFRYQSHQIDKEFAVIGSALAGHPFDGSISEDECVRITTGAPLPEGADTVEMQENCDINGKQVRLLESVATGQHVRQIGSSVQAGQEILSKGIRIAPKEQAIIASSGISEARVYKPITVAVFTTGDELVSPGQKLASGQIYDSNRLTMLSMCQRMGYEIIDYGLVADDPHAIRQVMSEAAKIADVLLTSGGVSVGDADYIKPVLEEIGELDVWKVAIKPGKPIAIGRIGSCHFFGLPGNPVSTIVTLNQIVQPALKKLSGEQIKQPIRFQAICMNDLRKAPGRRDYQRGFASVDDYGQWQVRSTGPQGSGRLVSVTDGNCYIILEPENTGVRLGDMVTIELFDQSLA